MAETHVLSALKRQYGKTLGLIRAGEACGDDLAHLIAVIAMFNPDEDLTAIKPVRPYPADRGRWTVDALDLLKHEGVAMSARAVARRLLTERGMVHSLPNLQRAECTLHVVLGRLEGRGVVRENREPKRWRLG